MAGLTLLKSKDRRSLVCSRQRTQFAKIAPTASAYFSSAACLLTVIRPRIESAKSRVLVRLAFCSCKKLFNITTTVPVCLSYVASAVARSSKTPDSVSILPIDLLSRSGFCIKELCQRTELLALRGLLKTMQPLSRLLSPTRIRKDLQRRHHALKQHGSLVSTSARST
jgi:hypothetical protein